MRFPTVFQHIDIEVPSAAFKDKTADIKNWKDDIDSYLLLQLVSTTNKYLMPTRYLQKCCFDSFSNKELHKKAIGIREDYIRDSDVVLICNKHNKGTTKLFIHTCCWQHNLPAKQRDQLCQAVLQPQLLKLVKASTYFTSFRMFNQQGTFNGIDTCNNVTYGRFDFNSKLLSEAEARSSFNYTDINAHLTKLQTENVILEYVERGKRNFANRYSEGINCDKFITGATY
eukprot:15355851-Ditylum_brightwellii.AAC.1